MQTNEIIPIALVVVAAFFLVYAVYYVSKRRKKPAESPSLKPMPMSTVVETTKRAPVETPKPELAPIPKPEPIVEAPKAEPTKMAEVAPPIALMETAPPITVVETKSVEKTQDPKKEAKPKPNKKASSRKEQGFRIVEIEGIGEKYSEKLHAINIYHTAELLKAGATPAGRAELVEKTGISHDLILEWVNLSDLFRIKGIGEEYSDLLEEAGVDTVVELSRRRAENLHARILEVNMVKKLVRRPPNLANVEGWISEAKKLPRAVEY